MLDDSPLAKARAALEKSFDATFGGFTRRAEIPASDQHRALHAAVVRHLRRAPTPDLKALYMASLTLTRMAEGGLYDQLGGGFARYSVDGAWMIPHFEKMLYDNGQLLCEYARAHLATGEALFAKVAHETADWVLRDMRSPRAAFTPASTPTPKATRGSFMSGTRGEVQSLLTPREYSAFSARFGLDRAANFEGEWHLHAFASLDAIAGALNESAASGGRPDRIRALEALEGAQLARLAGAR